MSAITTTPGPWRIGDAGWTVFGSPNGQPAPSVVATVRHRADARLIAAAPELLEALLCIRAHVEDTLIRPTRGAHSRAVIAAIGKVLAPALAKVTP